MCVTESDYKWKLILEHLQDRVSVNTRPDTNDSTEELAYSISLFKQKKTANVT